MMTPEEIELWRKGDRFDAIRSVRQRLGLGLIEAKDYVNSYMAKQKPVAEPVAMNDDNNDDFARQDMSTPVDDFVRNLKHKEKELTVKLLRRIADVGDAVNETNEILTFYNGLKDTCGRRTLRKGKSSIKRPD